MRIYYINLDERPDRRAFMEEQFARHGLSAIRVRAVTPRELTAEQLDRHCNPRRGHWLEPGALCCSLSHLETIRQIAADSAPFGLVLEDDAILSSRLPRFVRAFESLAPPIDLLRLETTLQSQRMLTSDVGPLEGIEIRRTFSWPGGAAAYIISRSAAKIVAASGELDRKAADQALLDPYEPLAKRLTLRQTSPGLAIQTNNAPKSATPDMGSDITHGSRDEAERPYYWRRMPYVVARWIRRDIVVGAEKAWHQYVQGAHKQFIPFLP